jgi:hypothetical protein
MQVRSPTESRTTGAIEENLPGLVDVFLKLDSEIQRRIAGNMGDAQACFLPGMLFTFAPVLGIFIRHDNRHHTAVRLGDYTIPACYCRIFFNSLLSASFMYVSGVSFRDIPDSAYRQGYPVMFPQFFRNPTERMIRAEIGHDTLQGNRTASAGYPGTFTERPKPFSGPPVFLLNHVNFTEGAVPTDFF